MTYRFTGFENTAPGTEFARNFCAGFGPRCACCGNFQSADNDQFYKHLIITPATQCVFLNDISTTLRYYDVFGFLALLI